MNGCYLPDVNKTKIDVHEIKQFTSEHDFTGLSLDLLIEVGSYVCIAGNIFPCDSKSWSIGQAVVGGHFVRLYKLITAMLDQTCQHRRETSFVFARLAFECIVNIRYLIKNASDDLFWSYRAYSLKHELKLYNRIKKNISGRGGEILEIEQRMIGSIEKSFESSGIKIDEVKKLKLRNWGGKNLYEKAEDVGLEGAYLAAFGGGSHSVHGNWQDMLEYNLEILPNGNFSPVFEWHPPRPQLLDAISKLSVGAIFDYLNWITEGESEAIEKQLLDLLKRIEILGRLHEEYLNKNK